MSQAGAEVVRPEEWGLSGVTAAAASSASGGPNERKRGRTTGAQPAWTGARSSG